MRREIFATASGFQSSSSVRPDIQRRCKGRRAGTGRPRPSPIPLAAQSLDQLSATLDRSLFSPSRRPPPAPPPVVQAPAPAALPPAPPNVVLLGVVMDGESARAVVRAGADKRLLRAQMGDEIDGWKVAQIDGRKVVLASQDGRFATYRLFNDERGAIRSERRSGVGRAKIRKCSKLRRPSVHHDSFCSKA